MSRRPHAGVWAWVVLLAGCGRSNESASSAAVVPVGAAHSFACANGSVTDAGSDGARTRSVSVISGSTSTDSRGIAEAVCSREDAFRACFPEGNARGSVEVSLTCSGGRVTGASGVGASACVARAMIDAPTSFVGWAKYTENEGAR